MDYTAMSQLLIKIQMLQFAAVELNLYLDTHPNDQQALAQYNQIHSELMNCVSQYEKYYGPLLNFGFSPAKQNQWLWAELPWPWELKY